MSSPAPKRFYDGRKYDVPGSLGHCLMHLMLVMRREVESRMAQHGLTDAQWKPLWMLKALIERVRSETDRRVVHLRLTPAGEAVVEHVPHVLAAVNNDFLRGFNDKEFQQLRTFIDRMVANGHAMQRDEEAAA
jgi:hypothetical protein